jgi:CDP-glucose 4,6-dehydratase
VDLRLAAVENLGMIDRAFWQGRRVLLTGHTGFKGTWLSLWLEQLGADVHGLALAPDTSPALFPLLAPFKRQQSHLGDIRDAGAVAQAVHEAKPQIAIHMAAQPLVRRSYRDPVETYATNVMGTVHVLDALRVSEDLQAVLVITTDKVYHNAGESRPFTEADPLGGHDPYATSKVAAEFVTVSFADSFFASKGIPVATARAGNVIGGGDWAADRIVPDLWRALRAGEPLRLRYPRATRPWQHVLEPLGGYLVYVEKLVRGGDPPVALNFGPLPGAAITVAEVADIMLKAFGSPLRWLPVEDGAPQPMEAPALALDPSLAAAALGWRPRLTAAQALDWTAGWYRAFNDGSDARALCLEQLRRYEAMT